MFYIKNIKYFSMLIRTALLLRIAPTVTTTSSSAVLCRGVINHFVVPAGIKEWISACFWRSLP